jgi:MFS family permease
MPRTSNRGFSNVLNNRNFLFLWGAQILSQTAMNGIHLTQMVLIEELTRSSAQLGIVILAWSLPAVLFSAVAGVVVDRFPNKWVLVTSNVLRILTASSYILVLRTLGGYSLLLAIYTITFIASAIGQFFSPAEAATIPLLVNHQHLLAANSLFSLTLTASAVVGLILLGPLGIKLLGVEDSFAAIAIIYSGAAVLVALLPKDNPRPSRNSYASSAIKRTVAEVREGWQFVGSHRPVLAALLRVTLIATLALIMAMLVPGFAARVLGMNPEDAVYIFAPAGLGLVLSTYLVGRFGYLVKREILINMGLGTMVLTLIALGLVSRGHRTLSVPLFEAYPQAAVNLTTAVMILTAFLGFSIVLVNIPAQTTLQEKTPLEVRGRVFAVQFLLANVAGLPPTLFIGTLADRIGIPRVILLIAGGVAVTGGLGTYFALTKRNEPESRGNSR